MVLNTTFNNISAISWRAVSFIGEHRQTLSHNVVWSALRLFKVLFYWLKLNVEPYEKTIVTTRLFSLPIVTTRPFSLPIVTTRLFSLPCK